MATITLPKVRYDLLKKRASLYEAILRNLPERRWGIEEYSAQRIQEFARQNKLTSKTLRRLKKDIA